MASRNEIVDELTGDRQRGVDGVARNIAVRMANRQSRRSFLAFTGKAAIASLGGAFIDVLWLERADAANCYDDVPYSCLCTQYRGNNSCVTGECTAGSWLYCALYPANYNCYNPDTRTNHYRRFRDCTLGSTCGCDMSKGCPHCCTTSPYYNTCGGSCTKQKVSCVVSTCTTIQCP